MDLILGFRQNSNEVNISVIIHLVLFITKNLVVYLLANPNDLLDAPELITPVLNKLMILFVNHMTMFVGFAYSVMNKDVEGYKNARITFLVLYMQCVVVALQVLVIYILSDMYVNWALVILMANTSVAELLATMKIIKWLEPISLKNILLISTDDGKVNAFKARKTLESIKPGILTFYIICLLKISIEKHWFPIQVPEGFTPVCCTSNRFSIEYILDVLLFASGIALLALLSGGLAYENMQQRLAILTMLIISAISCFFIVILHVLEKNSSIINMCSVHLFMFLNTCWCIYVVREEMHTIGSGIKDDILNPTARQINKRKV